jgi:hypothetical protein
MSKKLICLAAVGLMLAVAGSAGAQVGKGKVLFEYWENIGSGTTIPDLTNNALYPNKPTSSEWRDKFQSPSGRSDNAGMRARAYLTPPADGDYTFWVAGDDACQLWLSTDDNPANAKMIAQVASWTNVAEWGKEAGQKSAPQALKANKVYYIEGLEKEGGGGDSLDVGWAGPGIGDATVVLDGKYCTAFIRSPEPLFKASKPSPANGATEVVSPMFTWTPGATAALNHVYCGFDPNLTAAGDDQGPAPTINGQGMFYLMSGLTPGAKYYWRVDEADATGTVFTGDTWSFTVAPMEAHNPTPPDGMLGRPLNVQLKWVAGQGADSHKIYVSPDQAKVAAGDASVLAATQKELTFSPAGLVPNTTYYWRVDEIDSAGKVSGVGPVWSFATFDPAGGAVAEFWNDANLSFYNLDLLGPAPVVKTVATVDTSWPDGTVMGTNSPDAAINTNYFFGRFTALLKVPVSGKYTLIESSDDGGVVYLNGAQVAGQWATGGEAEFASAPLDLVAGQRYLLTYEYFEATGGAAARLRWTGPGISKQAIWQGALMPPDCAVGPIPRNGAVEVADSATLSWVAPANALVHTVYFGTDQAKVAAGDKTVAQAPAVVTKFAPASPLAWNTKYYWKVDETLADGSTVSSEVWSFTTANFIPVQMPQVAFSYNDIGDPFMSQTGFAVPADLTKNGVADLALRFQGAAAPAAANAACGVVYNDANSVYKVSGNGTDIWNTTDQFEYAYKTLTGDGSMIARVASIGPGTNTWAKGGVMIRQSLNGNSTYAITAITPDSTGNGGNGGCFQYRLTTAASAAAGPNPTPAVAAPYWVKLERKGNAFSGFLSADGKTWTQLGVTQTIAMTDPVCIGLAVTSHDAWATAPRTVTFDNVSMQGNIAPAGPFTVAKDVAQGNEKLPLYVALEDKAGKLAVVTHANAAAVNTTVFDLWRVPLSAFTGVDLKNAAKLYVGVGDGKSAGSGTLNLADLRILKPVTLPAADAVDVTDPNSVLKGFPDYAGSSPATEIPKNVIDNKVATKYLNFANSGSTGGKTVMPTGFCVTPSVGATVVTGLTFTAANDSPDRDPLNWELYGAYTSIDGPWYLITKGTIDDFARGNRDRIATNLDWPRNWKGVTPIGFANSTAFSSYKVSFTAVKRPLVANSMQIAEVELLGVPGTQPVITDVIRANGQSGNRTDGSPINGAYTGNTAPVRMQAGGLKDGNFVYSDRNYPWSLTPKELIGAEYVLTYNQDKTGGEKDVTYTVTFSKAATVAITCDDRIPAEWNSSGTITSQQAAVDRVVAAFAAPGQFKNTGLKICVHENATTDRPMSVFAADLPAGTYVFDSMDSDKNFYTIGAIAK